MDNINIILHKACFSGDIGTMKSTINLGADIEAKDDCGQTPLFVASNNGCLKIVKYLVSIGADIEVANYRGWTPLIATSHYGNVAIVKYLLECGADMSSIDDEGKTFIDHLVEEYKDEIVEYANQLGGGKSLKATLEK